MSDIQSRTVGVLRKLFSLRVASGSIVAFIGYILSPASWWNDAFVNIPIAYVAASIASQLNRDLFGPAFATAYLVTNIVGFLMMHTGAEIAVKGRPSLTWKTLLKYAIVSAAYTAIAVLLVKIGVIEPLTFNW